ncbi:MAG: MBL fold metallo-hydrolase [Pyrinomonadaceae bacterium]|nr:MBL fold metallo-hydrolase [Phycisphaerales bacterium]
MSTPSPTYPVPAPSSQRYTWRLLRAASFRLDGGSMFGLIPRSVWSRTAVPDEKGRIQVQHNCLLLEPAPSPAPAANPSTAASETSTKALSKIVPKRLLIEVGTGDKLDQKSRDIFMMENRSITDALAEVSVPLESIDAVVVSHLHFDHAGGLTRLCKPGETPDWTGPASTMAGARPDHGVKLTFPNARVHTQQREWTDAIADKSVMTRTYFRDHLEPIRDRIVPVDSPRPFPSGYVPDRDELPRGGVELRETEVLPGVSVFLVPGHTWGQQAIKFTDQAGNVIVFTPDVMPTMWHSGAAYSLGYDVEPYTSMISRRWFLTEAAKHNWLLCLDHEPGNPLCRVRENAKGWFDLVVEG